MRWKKMIATALAGVMLLAGVSCKKATVNTSPELHFETDNQYWLSQGLFTMRAESETGFYYFEDTNPSILYYADKETMQSIPVCNKPNCVAHDNPREATDAELENCNAYLYTKNQKLLYYEGALYAVMQEGTMEGNEVLTSFSLVRISLDGTERKVVWEIDPGVPVGYGSLWDFILHRGKFYFTVNDVLYSYDLDNEKVAEIRKFETLPTLYAMGDHLFVRSEGNGIDEGLFRYTISTGEWKQYPKECVEVFPHHGGMYFYCIQEEPTVKLWGVETDRNGDNETTVEYEENLVPMALSDKYLMAQKLGTYRLIETGESLTLEEFNELAEKYEGTDVVVDNLVEPVPVSTYEIYDRKTMEVLGSLPKLRTLDRPWFSEDRIYFVALDTERCEENYEPCTIYYADLADLGSDAFAWKVVEPSR